MKSFAFLGAFPGALVLLIGISLAPTRARADEGMWTFDNFPSARVEAAYGFSPDQAWLDHVRMSSARLNIGCSSGIVSGEGLIQTNHHCVTGCVQDLSTPGNNLVETGFIAATSPQERRCAGYSADVLIAISDVTQRINQATAAAGGDAFTTARDAEISRIESVCRGGRPDRRCEVVTFYQGGQYKLYVYKRYDDVRLLFAPEEAAAFFGGDPDNFNFPRYNFDVAFLRLYENGQPARTPEHLRWRSEPVREGELLFTSGNPYSTSRLFTTSQLALLRDQLLPWRMATLSELRGRLLRFASESPDHARMAADTLDFVENSFKAFNGERRALVDPAVFEAQAQRQRDLQRRVGANAAIARDVGDAWDEVSRAEAAYAGFYLSHQYAEVSAGGGSELFYRARALVRAAAERVKPDDQRLPQYTEARLPALRQYLFSEAPIEAPLEELELAFWLSKLREYLTADDPLVTTMLGRESPEELAHRLVSDTHLADLGERHRLYDGGAAAIASSTDAMIVFVRGFDAQARALRTRYNQEVEGPIDRAQQRIAHARFLIDGTSDYPDATFTLRLSYGRVQGWTEPGGRVVQPFTHFGGLYRRATDWFPYRLPERWVSAQARLSPNTVFNFSTNTDIVGGNSGSPVIDRQGRVVGAVFDGNIWSLGGDYLFDPILNRTVVVAATGIEEGLVKVYGLQRIVDELRR